MLTAADDIDAAFVHQSSAGEIRAQLDMLYERLSKHFAVEEASWLSREAGLEHPEAAADIEALVGEHHTMLAGLRRMLWDRDCPREELRAHWDGVAALLRRHEQAESELLQVLLYEDVGGLG